MWRRARLFWGTCGYARPKVAWVPDPGATGAHLLTGYEHEANLPDRPRRPGPCAEESLYPEQILQPLRQAEGGTTPVVDICRKMGITETTLYRWEKQYEGLDASELRELTVFAIPSQYREVPFGLPPALAPGPAASPK